jgi:hypothetical protein
MEQFEKNSNYKGMVEGFMKQLITKEILYEPMKALFDKVRYILKIGQKEVS